MINSDIIWKKFNNTLSREEEAEFSKWIKKKIINYTSRERYDILKMVQILKMIE